MRWSFFVLGLIFLAPKGYCTFIKYTDLDDRLLPYSIYIPMLPVKKEPVAEVQVMKRVPSAEDLPTPFWQNIFYERHHCGPQHLLICANDNDLFQGYLAALIRLLQHNSECRITIIAPKSEHTSLRLQVKQLIIEKVRPNSSILRDLHFLDQPFREDSSSNQTVRNSMGGDKYTGIVLACPRDDYRPIKAWLHNSKAVLYIPYTGNPDNIRDKLYKAGFRTHEVLTADTMICAATSDHTSFPKERLYPAHNPDRVETPEIKRNVKIDRQCHLCGEHSKDK